MQLFTKSQYNLLIKNGSDQQSNKDYPPVVKLFMTNTACTWLISELDPENPDIAFGLCDLGFGCPELGSISIAELQEAQNPRLFRFLERDRCFTGSYPLSIYYRAAFRADQIVTDEASLQQAALKPQP